MRWQDASHQLNYQESEVIMHIHPTRLGMIPEVTKALAFILSPLSIRAKLYYKEAKDKTASA